MIGDVLHDRYHIVDKLGFGGYSTVWLARDSHLQRYVAVKINAAMLLRARQTFSGLYLLLFQALR
ncbi:hypothetical protein PENSUB_14078 [Penicillium subrubescens]|jgi:predicted O-methyltransferase YrrM|uniref:non-specific serine/threonine protein kinase n=1 Tax=Penicillium subrubescens TaxID=1316194 RepID=A0A1Q5UPS2_9EURO|nr:hypothetical protein PENSUB_14078 [Penicillium subrubescens]